MRDLASGSEIATGFRPRCRAAACRVRGWACSRQPVKPVTPRVLLLGSSNTRGATVGIKEDIKSVGAFGVTVSPDVTVVSDRYGGFVTPLAPSLTPPARYAPSLVGGSRGGWRDA